MMQASHTAAGRRTFAAGAVVSLLAMSAVALGSTAVAQDSSLILKLKAGVKCSERDASKQLMRNAAGSGAGLNDLLAALDEISIDGKACVQIKDAASDLVLDLARDDPAASADEPPAEVEADPEAELQPDIVAAATAERMLQALAEADQRAAAMRFEVGPPPRNLTRSRAVSQ